MRKNNKHGSLFSYINSVEVDMPLDKARVFGRSAPLEVEIGSGTGEYLVGLAKNSPGTDHLGLEVSAERVIKTLRKIHEAGLTNARVMRIDAFWAFRYLLSPASIARVHCLFPCPWPKKRHVRHRLFSNAFLDLVHGRLMDGGALRIVTDHHPFARWIREGFDGKGYHLETRKVPPVFGTKFEKKWREGGQEEFDELIFTKISAREGQEERTYLMKMYFLETIDPDAVRFPQETGDVAIRFRYFIFDKDRQMGVLQAIVSEDDRQQYLWMMITLSRKGWCLRAATGQCVLPTYGVVRALELAYEAFLASGS